MEYLAHSAQAGCPPQTYAAHVEGVCRKAVKYAEEAAQYARKGGSQLKDIVQRSAIWHDLGKLDCENQKVLRGEQATENGHLPINHTDAGATLLKENSSLYSALAVYSHHRGLPDMEAEFSRTGAIFRDEHPAVREQVDKSLPSLLQRHKETGCSDDRGEESPYDGGQSVFFE